MNKYALPIFAVAAFAVTLTSCSTAKPPMAVSKSVYTSITDDEHLKLPEDIKLLSLEEAQEIAVQNNPNFKSRYFVISQARAKYYSAFSNYVPTVTATYALSSDHQRGYTEDAGASRKIYTAAPSLNASMVLFDSFKREMDLLAARHDWKRTELEEQDSRRLLLQSVANAYNQVMLARSKRLIAIEDMRYNRILLKETELKYGVGASTLSDVLNFKVNYNQAESGLYAANYLLNVAKITLATLMGLTQGELPEYIEFPDSLSADGEMLSDVNVYLDMALANRPDLKALREAVEKSKFSYYSSIAQFGPTVTGSIGLSYTNQSRTYSPMSHDSGIFSSGYRNNDRHSNFTSSISVNWEIFSGGRTYFAMRSAQAALEQSEYTVANTWLSVISDVRTAHENYLTNLKTVKLYQKNLEAVRKMRDLVDDEYEAGNCSITRVNEVQTKFVNAENALTQSIVDLHNAKAQLLAATNAI